MHKEEISVKETMMIERIAAIIEEHCGENPGALDGLLRPQVKSWNEAGGRVVLVYPLAQWQQNNRGTIHGGVMAAFFDHSFGLVGLAASGVKGGAKDITTAELSVSYLSGVDGDDTLEVTVFIKKVGATLVRMMGEAVSLKTGKLAATAMGSYVPLQDK